MEANFVLNYDVVSMGREDNLYVLAPSPEPERSLGSQRIDGWREAELRETGGAVPC
jgi:hypothetical protein